MKISKVLCVRSASWMAAQYVGTGPTYTFCSYTQSNNVPLTQATQWIVNVQGKKQQSTYLGQIQPHFAKINSEDHLLFEAVFDFGCFVFVLTVGRLPIVADSPGRTWLNLSNATAMSRDSDR